MGLFVEISVDVTKNSNVSQIKLFLSELAKTHNCNSEYYIYETEGTNSKIERNECIHTVEFNIPLTESERLDIIKYITKIKNIKYTKLETIYKENGKIDVIYNSQKSEFINSNGKKKYIKIKPIISEILKQLY